MKQFQRTELLLGEEGLGRLRESSVAVIGLGGVGGFTAEALARSGVGKIILTDYDFIDETNINRQLIADKNNIGKKKVFEWEKRIRNITDDIEIASYDEKLSSENSDFLWNENPTYIADAIDDVRAKIFLIVEAKRRNIPIISAMGAGNKLDASAFKIADIYDTSHDALARVIRRALRKENIDSHKVVCSTEINDFDFRNPVGSVAFCPSVAGLIMAGEIIREIARA